jgi:hypothetical protein
MRKLLALSVLFILGCSQPVAPTGDYAAVLFFDCSQLAVVTFMSYDGKFQQIPIQSAAQLFDMQLRVSQIEYTRVQYIVNPRPCGFPVDS